MKTHPQHNYLTYLLAGGLLLGAVIPASGIITADSTNANEDERSLQTVARSEFGARPIFPYFRNLGALGRSSGIYMGNGFVLTAAHVGSQPFRLFDNSVYQPVAGSERNVLNHDRTPSDLLIFRIAYSPHDTVARLLKIPLGPIAPPPGSRVLMLGAGAGATADGPAFAWDDNYIQRWGLNRVEHRFTDMIESAGFRTPGFSTKFDGPWRVPSSSRRFRRRSFCF